MLKDIVINTRKILNEFIPSNAKINSKRALYDLYRAMHVMIDDIELVSEHYLALDFTEEFLQNSSHGKPSDKWRRFFNEDLERLNKSTKKYLMKLNSIADANDHSMCGSYLSNIYSAKSLYGFVRDEYNVGFVKPCSFSLISEVLLVDIDPDSHHMCKFSKIDLSTYEQRVALRDLLREQRKILQSEHQKLKEYILKNTTLEELL